MPTRQGQVPEAIFPSTPLGVPRLDLDLAARWVEAPVRGWGAVSRRSRMRGTWHFYVSDYKFATLYRDPSSVTLSRAVAAVEPNYTIGDQMPYSVALYRIYQKRWVNRYWQTLGLLTFVDLSVPPEYEDLNLEGVPEGWAAFATKAADSRIDELERHYATACKFNSKPVFLIYGGGRKVEALAHKLEAGSSKPPEPSSRKLKKGTVDMGNDGAKGGGGGAGGAGRVGRTVKLTQAQKDAQDLEKVQALKDQMELEAANARGGITKDEDRAIMQYTGSHYRDLNLMLYTGREAEMDYDMRKMKENLDSGLAKLPRYDKTTYRGLRFYDEDERANFVGQFVEGDYVKMPAFTSTAASDKGFGYNHYNTPNGVQIEFRSTRGRDLSGRMGGKAYNPSEEEVVFERNSTFRVVSKTRTSNEGSKIVVTDD